MNNVIQNINIDDIIPSKFQPTMEETRKIEELAQIIRVYGLIDPIIVRSKNGKYEIILGNDKYQAAKKANAKQVPIIIKEIDDEAFSKYFNIEKGKTNSSNSSSIETFSKKEKNRDIINLADLSKTEIRNERADFTMNNNQINNDVNNNLGASQTPTFGGKFFPSLEDEPTNMNMMGNFNNSSPTPVNQNMNQVMPNNNLIDLTDLSGEKETPLTPNNNLNTYPNTTPPSMEPSFNVNQPPLAVEHNINTLNQEPIASEDPNNNIINLGNLESNNPQVIPNNEPVSMDILNSDFGVPTNPNTTPNIATNNLEPNLLKPNLELNQSVSTPVTNPQVTSEISVNTPQPNFNNNLEPVTPNINITPPSFTNQPIEPNYNTTQVLQSNQNPILEQTSLSQDTIKDVTPVSNTIKDLVLNLQTFGYNINVNEEVLPDINRITIEIKK